MSRSISAQYNFRLPQRHLETSSDLLFNNYWDCFSAFVIQCFSSIASPPSISVHCDTLYHSPIDLKKPVLELKVPNVFRELCFVRVCLVLERFTMVSIWFFESICCPINVLLRLSVISCRYVCFINKAVCKAFAYEAPYVKILFG